MTDKQKQTLTIVLSVLLAVAGALFGLDGIPPKLHALAGVLMSIGGAVGTALLPGVSLPGKPPEAKS